MIEMTRFSDYKCCLCGRRRPEVKLHRIPSSQTYKDIYDLWIDTIASVVEEIRTLSPSYVRGSVRVCEKHFLESHYYTMPRSNERKLKKNSVPLTGITDFQLTNFDNKSSERSSESLTCSPSSPKSHCLYLTSGKDFHINDAQSVDPLADSTGMHPAAGSNVLIEPTATEIVITPDLPLLYE